jgi:hypothetical protein
MPYVNDEIFDQGLDYADTNGTRIDICYTQEPANYTEATSTYSCGNKTGLNTGATVDGATDGRRVIVPAITDGSVTATQTAGWWALTDGTSIFLAAGPLSATQAVTNGNQFQLDAISITKRDATAP